MLWCCVADADVDSSSSPGLVGNVPVVDQVSLSETYDSKPLPTEQAPAVDKEEPAKQVQEELPADNQPAVVVEETQEVPKAEPEQQVDAQQPTDELLPMYTISLSKTDDKSFGAQFDLTDPDRPVIVKVLPDTYLSGGLSGPCPTVGSALVSVNDKIVDGPGMVRKLRERGPVSATFKEPRRHTVVLPMGEGPHGLEMKPTSSDELGLFVHAVSGRASTSGLQVRDFIVEIDGRKDKPQALYDTLRNATSDIRLGVLTYNEEAKQRTVIIPQGVGPLGLEMKEVAKGVPAPGLVVISASGRAAAAGVRSRDSIIGVNGQFIAPAALYSLMCAGGKDLKLVISTPSS